MNDALKFAAYLLIMAGVTYLVRMIPLVLVKHKIENRFIRSFLYYIPYSVLAVMTVPAIFSATSSVVSASVGLAAALITAYFEKSLITVAISGCSAVFITELILRFI